MILSGDLFQLPPVIRRSEQWVLHRKQVERVKQQRLQWERQVLEKRREHMSLEPLGESHQNEPSSATTNGTKSSKYSKQNGKQDLASRLQQATLSPEERQTMIRLFPLPSEVDSYVDRFCFDAKSWPYIVGRAAENALDLDERASTTQGKAFELGQVFRQQSDPLFCDFLNFLRHFDMAESSESDKERNESNKQVDSKNHASQSRRLFPVVDALFRHLAMPFEERTECPLFRAIASGHVQSLQDLLPWVRRMPEVPGVFERGDPLEQELGNWEFDLTKWSSLSKAAVPSPEALQLLASSWIEPVHLFPLRKDVDQYNEKRLEQCQESKLLVRCVAMDCPDSKLSQEQRNLLQWDNATLPTVLSLREGAQVMLLKNLQPSLGLVNGSIGVVEEMAEVRLQDLYGVLGDDGGSNANKTQVSMSPSKEKAKATRLRRALTNLTDSISADPEKSKYHLPDDPVMYLPRIRFPVRNSHSLEEWEQKLATMSHDPLYQQHPEWLPRLEPVDSGQHTISLLIGPQKEPVSVDAAALHATRTPTASGAVAQTDDSKAPTSYRFQLPLQLAWSYSVHKAQGQTLPKLHVDIHDIFQYGQVYVALSRGTSLCGLQLCGYSNTIAAGKSDSPRGRLWKLLRHDRAVEFTLHLRQQSGAS